MNLREKRLELGLTQDDLWIESNKIEEGKLPFRAIERIERGIKVSQEQIDWVNYVLQEIRDRRLKMVDRRGIISADMLALIDRHVGECKEMGIDMDWSDIVTHMRRSLMGKSKVV